MPEEKNRSKKMTFLQTLTSGTISGICEVGVNHPLWVVKTRIQCGHTPVWGLRGMYHGLSSNMASMVPLIAMRISLGTTFQNKFFGVNENLSSSQRILSALFGGCIPSLIGSPLELTRTQQQKTKLSLYTTASNSVNKNGVASLLSGMPATMARDMLYTCGFFAMAPIIKKSIQQHYDNDMVATAVSGPIAGAFSAFSSQPFDAIKSHQQLALEKRRVTMTQACNEIVSTNGYGGFFKGAMPRIMRVISGVTIIYNTNRTITDYFEDRNSSGANNSPCPRA